MRRATRLILIAYFKYMFGSHNIGVAAKMMYHQILESTFRKHTKGISKDLEETSNQTRDSEDRNTQRTDFVADSSF